MSLVSLNGSVNQLIDLCAQDLQNIALHLFYADWQCKQFQKLIGNLPDNVLVQVHDFAKNYLCEFQDEVQGSFWDHSQVTIHPTICYYKNESGKLITEEVVCITGDLKHDSYAVQKLEQIVDRHFTEHKHGQYCTVH